MDRILPDTGSEVHSNLWKSPFYRESAPSGWCFNAGGVEITGELARCIYEGGSPSWQRKALCDCTPDVAYDVSEGGRYNLWSKRQSCAHIVSSLVYALVRAGVSLPAVWALAADSDNRGFAWLQHRAHDPSGPDTWWNAAPLTVLGSMYARARSWTRKPLSVKVSLPKASTAKDGFRFHTACWMKFLQLLAKNPTAGRRDVENLMMYRFRWRRGVTAKYLGEAIRRGFVTATSGGPRGKLSYTVADWPPVPQRQPLEHRVDLMTGELYVTRAKRLTPSAARYAIFRGIDVEQAIADLQFWEAQEDAAREESVARKFRAQRYRLAEQVAA